MRRIFVVSALTAAALAASPAAASADSGGVTELAGSAAVPQGRLAVKVEVSRFRATKSGPVADGVATAKLVGLGQLPTTVRKKVHLSAARSGSCTILTLRLDTLDLTLLGLNVHLDKVDLKVTGRSRGGVLGSLFCKLARAKVKTSRVAAAAALTREIKRTGTLRPLALSVPVRGMAAQAGSCKVLDLVLGPLNVNLLGLIVDLKKVHLVITASPTGGVLGSLFCGLANTQIP